MQIYVTETADWCETPSDPSSTIVSVTITKSISRILITHAGICVCVREREREREMWDSNSGVAEGSRYVGCIVNITAWAFPNILKDRGFSSSESRGLLGLLDPEHEDTGTTYPMTQHQIPEVLNLQYVCAVQITSHVTAICAASFIKGAFSSSWFTWKYDKFKGLQTKDTGW